MLISSSSAGLDPQRADSPYVDSCLASGPGQNDTVACIATVAGLRAKEHTCSHVLYALVEMDPQCLARQEMRSQICKHKTIQRFVGHPGGKRVMSRKVGWRRRSFQEWEVTRKGRSHKVPFGFVAAQMRNGYLDLNVTC